MWQQQKERSPWHVAEAERAFSMVQWLLEEAPTCGSKKERSSVVQVVAGRRSTSELVGPASAHSIRIPYQSPRPSALAETGSGPLSRKLGDAANRANPPAFFPNAARDLSQKILVSIPRVPCTSAPMPTDSSILGGARGGGTEAQWIPGISGNRTPTRSVEGRFHSCSRVETSQDLSLPFLGRGSTTKTKAQRPILPSFTLTPDPPRPTALVVQVAILRKIHHPNTTQFLGACTKTKPLVLLTELMACSLADALQLSFLSPSLRRKTTPLVLLTELMACSLADPLQLSFLSPSLRRKSLVVRPSSQSVARRPVLPPSVLVARAPSSLRTVLVVRPLSSVLSLVVVPRRPSLFPRRTVTDFGLSKSLTPVERQHSEDGTQKSADVPDDVSTFLLTGETGSYSYAIIMFQIFEASIPYAGLDPLTAARRAAINGLRPRFSEKPNIGAVDKASSNGQRPRFAEKPNIARRAAINGLRPRFSEKPNIGAVEKTAARGAAINGLGPRFAEKPNIGAMEKNRDCFSNQK
eukprot:gene18142-24582_t